MKHKHLFAAIIGSAVFFMIACGGKDKKGDNNTPTEEKTETTVKPTDADIVPVIDTASLKDEASILAAMQQVVDAQIADDKKKKEDPNYSGHYLELTKLYTSVLKASTAYSKSLADPAKAVEFSNKISEIQKKMY